MPVEGKSLQKEHAVWIQSRLDLAFSIRAVDLFFFLLGMYTATRYDY